MKSSFFVMIFFLLSSCAVKKVAMQSQYGTFTDDRDGQVYKTVKIGTQVWMAQNLNFKIDGAENYDRNPANGAIYGMLYAFSAAQSAAPKGWHPSKAEWELMERSCSNPVTTLNILFGGEYGAGKFRYLNAKATFYTTTHAGTPILTRYVDKGDDTFRFNKQGTAWHLSVRCVRDEPAE